MDSYIYWAVGDSQYGNAPLKMSPADPDICLSDPVVSLPAITCLKVSKPLTLPQKYTVINSLTSIKDRTHTGSWKFNE